LSDPEYCRFIAHDDDRVARLIACAHRRHVAGGDLYLADTREGWAEASGQSFKQVRVGLAHARQLPFLGLSVEQVVVDAVPVRAVAIRLLVRALPDRPVGAIDWTAVRRSAPWRKPYPKRKPKAAPDPVPVPVAVSAPAPVDEPAPVEAPKPAAPPKVKQAPPKHVAGPPCSGVPFAVPSGGGVSVDPRKVARRRSFGWRVRAWTAILAEDFPGAAHCLQELCGISPSMRQALGPGDLWLLNSWTYEDPEVEQRIAAGKFYVERPHWWPDRTTPATFTGVIRMRREIEDAQKQRRKEAKAKVAAALRPTMRFLHPQPPSCRRLLEMLREAVVAAGFRDRMAS
jgi:hypothetical protein